mmetsp:Transcript_35823/g.73018  ORF Transcript_35823/g.73018 Transcript_35823/m.73018 type:complete len:585 (-) Transcript_35823:226-1980(-)
MARWANCVVTFLALAVPRSFASFLPVDLVDVHGKLNIAPLGDHVKAHSEAGKLKLVSSVGSPGCGKEALLNALFGTQFDEKPPLPGLAATAARPKCVASMCPSEPDVLVLGSDAASGSASREKSPLLALQGEVADVVLLHLWASEFSEDGGGAAAANRPVLRQLLAKQGGKKGKVVLVVHGDGDAEPASLEAAVLAEVDAAWESLAAVDKSLPKKVGEAVAVSLQVLPDPVADKPGFEQALQTLRATVLKASPSGSSHDGSSVAAAVAGAWEAAQEANVAKAGSTGLMSASAAAAEMSSEELRAVLCVDEAFESCALKVEAQLRAWRRTVEAGGLVENFGDKASTFGDEVMKAFNADTFADACSEPKATPVAFSRRSEKGRVLSSSLRKGVDGLSNAMLNTLTQRTLTKFEAALLNIVKKLKDPSESMPDELGNKALRKASAEFGSQSAKLVRPRKGGAADSERTVSTQVLSSQVDETMGQVLAQVLADFDESPAAKVVRMNRLQRKTERSKKQPKNPRAITPGLHLAGMVRQIGSGNLNGFAGYALGAHTVNFAYANDRGDPSAGDTSPLLRLQPKIHFDVDL